MTRILAWLLGLATAVVLTLGAILAWMSTPSRPVQKGRQSRSEQRPSKLSEAASLASVQRELDLATAQLDTALAQPSLAAQTDAITELLQAWNP